MASKRAVQDAKAKQKKQKILVAVGGVLLLALLAFEIPNTMKLMKQSSGQSQQSSSQLAAATPTTTASTAPPDGSLTPPSLSGSAAASTPAPSSGLVDNPSAAPQEGQLGSLDRFIAKDPFKQQLTIAAPPDGTSIGGAPSAPPATGKGGGSAVPPSGASTTPATTTSTTPTPPPANPTIATISINGASEDVAAGAVFPKSAAQPYFQLVSLGAGSAKVGIAGGSLAGGGATVTLVKGKKLTLMNTADGTRYELVLVALK